MHSAMLFALYCLISAIHTALCGQICNLLRFKPSLQQLNCASETNAKRKLIVFRSAFAQMFALRGMKLLSTNCSNTSSAVIILILIAMNLALAVESCSLDMKPRLPSYCNMESMFDVKHLCPMTRSVSRLYYFKVRILKVHIIKVCMYVMISEEFRSTC